MQSGREPTIEPMSTPRFFLASLDGERLTLVGDEAHHAVRVRRLGVGDEVELFDAQGGEARGRIVEVETNRVDIRVSERHKRHTRGATLMVAAAIPKGERADWMVEKLAELGVAILVPLITARGVVRPSEAKLERWRRKCVEAAKQCGAPYPMSVAVPVGIAGLANLMRGVDCVFVADPDLRWGAYTQRANELQKANGMVIIGPEGGWTAGELKLLMESGAQPVRLTQTTLRVESAAIAMAALFALEAAGRAGRE